MGGPFRFEAGQWIVTAPLPSEQFRKTPAYRREKETITIERFEPVGYGDGRELVYYIPEDWVVECVLVDDVEWSEVSFEPGKLTFVSPPRGSIVAVVRETQTFYRWIKFIRSRTTESGEVESTLLRWGDYFKELKLAIRDGTIVGVKQLVEELLGEEIQVESKKEAVVHLRNALLREPREITSRDLITQLRSDFESLGRWGLGCPGCREEENLRGASRFWWFKPDGRGGWIPADPAAYTPLTDPETGKVRNGYLDWDDELKVFICDRCGCKIHLEVKSDA